MNHSIFFKIICCCSVVPLQSPARLCNLTDCSIQAPLSFTISQRLLKFMSSELVMLSNHFILCHFLLLVPSIFPSIRVFSNESVLYIRWLKYWSFSISPSNEYSGLISPRIDWFDLLAVQATMQIKSTMRYYYPAIRMDQMKNSDNAIC